MTFCGMETNNDVSVFFVFAGEGEQKEPIQDVEDQDVS